MYHKHNTEGVVIGGSERGETSRSIVLFTRDFGLIHVSVQAGRAMASKLRYGVQDFTLGNFTLIKGRHTWKLVGAEEKLNILPDIKDKKVVLANIFNLISKFSGEDKNEKLYDIVLDSIPLFKDVEEREELKALESLIVLRILENLGFVRGASIFFDCINSKDVTKGDINFVKNKRFEAVSMINESIEAAKGMV